MKECSACGQTKALDGFYPEPRNSDGLRSDCKTCVIARSMRYAGKNKAAVQARLKEYNARRYPALREEILAKNKAWAAAHPESGRRRALKWRAANIEQERARDRTFAKNNPGLMTAKAMKRYAAKTGATPKWLTTEDYELIRFLYEEAAALSKAIGVKFHVDHIVPLRGKTVCGLHVPWNLRVIAASANQSKGNRLLAA